MDRNFDMLGVNKSSVKKLALLACLCLMTPTWAAYEDHPSGTVNITSKSVAVGVGVNWGRGTLNYQGAPHHFSIDGLSVLDLGISKITTRGEVFDLNNLDDFSGNYVAGNAGIAVAGGVNDVIMKNEHGVVLRLHGIEKGVRLQAGASGVTITVKD
jgi:hypothetical protein